MGKQDAITQSITHEPSDDVGNHSVITRAIASDAGDGEPAALLGNIAMSIGHLLRSQSGNVDAARRNPNR